MRPSPAASRRISATLCRSPSDTRSCVGSLPMTGCLTGRTWPLPGLSIAAMQDRLARLRRHEDVSLDRLVDPVLECAVGTVVARFEAVLREHGQGVVTGRDVGVPREPHGA